MVFSRLIDRIVAQSKCLNSVSILSLVFFVSEKLLKSNGGNCFSLDCSLLKEQRMTEESYGKI